MAGKGRLKVVFYNSPSKDADADGKGARKAFVFGNVAGTDPYTGKAAVARVDSTLTAMGNAHRGLSIMGVYPELQADLMASAEELHSDFVSAATSQLTAEQRAILRDGKKTTRKATQYEQIASVEFEVGAVKEPKPARKRRSA